MTTTEREIEMVTGTVDSIVAKAGGKWQAVVKTPESAQYGKKLWTKSEDVNAAVTALLGQVATFECGVSHYTLPDGKPTSSLWINAVNPGAPPPQEPPGAVEAVAAAAQETPPEAAGAPVSTSQPPQASRVSDPTRTSIERQTSLIQAVLFCGTPTLPATVAEVLDTAEDFYAYLTFQNPGRIGAPLPPDTEIPF